MVSMRMISEWFEFNGVVYEPDAVQYFQTNLSSSFISRLYVDPVLEARWLDEMDKIRSKRKKAPIMTRETFVTHYKFIKEAIDEWINNLTASQEKRELLTEHAYELLMQGWHAENVRVVLRDDYNRLGMTKRFH